MSRHTSGMAFFCPSLFGSSGVKKSACLRSLRARGSDDGAVDGSAIFGFALSSGTTSETGCGSAIFKEICASQDGPAPSLKKWQDSRICFPLWLCTCLFWLSMLLMTSMSLLARLSTSLAGGDLHLCLEQASDIKIDVFNHHHQRFLA